MSFRRGSLSSALELRVIGKPLVFDLSFYLYTFLKHFILPTQERLISFHAFQEWYEGHSLTISFCDENSQELNEKTRKLWKGCDKAKPCNSGKFNLCFSMSVPETIDHDLQRSKFNKLKKSLRLRKCVG